MERKGYVIRNQQAIYYLTFTVAGWIDIFTRQAYRDIVIESFKHCQRLSSPAFTQQKIDYIHQNPVQAGLVYRAEDYVYSSAPNYAGID